MSVTILTSWIESISKTFLRIGVVAEGLVIAGQAEQVAHPQRVGAQQVALDRQAVAVAAGHLDDRFQPFLDDDGPGADAGHAHDGGLVVGDVDRVDQ